jgi:hypothetical protein
MGDKGDSVCLRIQEWPTYAVYKPFLEYFLISYTQSIAEWGA